MTEFVNSIRKAFWSNVQYCAMLDSKNADSDSCNAAACYPRYYGNKTQNSPTPPPEAQVQMYPWGLDLMAKLWLFE